MKRLYVFLFACLAWTASFAQSGNDGPISWSLVDGVLTISGTGAMPVYTGSRVPPWYSYNSSIYSVVINPGVTSISGYAFTSCDKLTSIDIPDGVTSIGEYAFYYCRSMTSITIPKSVASIGEFAFYSCSKITDVDILSNVDSIGDYAFCNCGQLKHLTIEGSVSSIGASAFFACSQLTSLTLPAGLTSIGKKAFYSCGNLTSITLPASMESIKDSAFYSCYELNAITVDPANEMYSSEDGVLYNKDKSTLIQYPAGKTDASFIIPATVTTISNNAFYYCNLPAVNIPEGVTSIGADAFVNCYSLTAITVDPANEMYSSEDGVLYNKDISKLIQYPNGKRNASFSIPATVTSIRNSAFFYSLSLTTLTLPASLTSIENYAFAYCSGLTTITLPASVTSIGNYAFAYCNGFTTVTCLATTPPTVNANVFYNLTPGRLTLAVPAASTSAYKAAPVWGTFGVITFTDPLVSFTWTGSVAQKSFLLRASKIGSGNKNVIIDWGNNKIDSVAGNDNTSATASITYGNAGTYTVRIGLADPSVKFTHLSLDDQEVSAVDLSKAIDLQQFWCQRNKVSSLNVANNTQLDYLYCPDNLLDSLDVHTNTLLTRLACNNNRLTTLDVSKNTRLQRLYCPGNKLQELDLSHNPSIVFFECYDNNLPLTELYDIMHDGSPYTSSSLISPQQLADTTAKTGEEITLPVIDGTYTTAWVKYAADSTDATAGIDYTTAGGTLTFLKAGEYIVIMTNGKVTNKSGVQAEVFVNYTVEDITVTVNANNTDWGSATGDGSYNFGALVTLTATPTNNGYRFVNWTVGGDTVSTENPYTFTMTEDVTVTANFVQGGKCGDNLFWTITGNTLTISGTGAMYNYNYNTYPWYNYRTSLTTLVIEPGATSIGRYAFYGCSGFTGSLTIPGSVTTIGEDAFSGCGGFTGTLIIPDRVTTIGDQAFYDCTGFTGTLTIPDSVITIGSQAFVSARFTALVIPGSVTTIENYAFKGCNQLTSITCMMETPLTIASATFLNIPQTIPLWVPCGSISKYKGAATWNEFTNIRSACDHNVEAIANNTSYGSVTGTGFYDNNSTATLTATPASTGYGVVNWTVDGDIVSTTATYSFTVTKDVTVTANFQAKYSVSAVSADTDLGSVSGSGSYFVDSTATLTATAKPDYRLACWTVNGDTVSTDPTYRFTVTGDVTVTANFAPGGQCGDHLFWAITDNTLTISGTGDMYDYAEGRAPWYDYRTSLTTLVIEPGATSIGENAFFYCDALTGSLVIPDGVTSIGNSAFYQSSSLNGSLTIPASVTTIEDYAFYGCTSLTSLTCMIENPLMTESNTFGYTNWSVPLMVPCGSIASYKKADNWNTFTTIKSTCSHEVKVSSNSAYGDVTGAGFYDNDSTATLTATSNSTKFRFVNWTVNGDTVSTDPIYSFTVTEDVTARANFVYGGQCGDHLFWDITSPLTISGTGDMYDYPAQGAPWYKDRLSIDSLVIEPGATSIGSHAFDDCYRIFNSLTIPSSVTSIGDYAFQGCNNIPGSLTIPDHVTTIGKHAFQYCNSFTGPLTIPGSVATIGDNAFFYCNSLDGPLTIEEGVVSIGDSAFYNCKSFTDTLTIPSTVTSIGAYAFDNCPQVTAIKCMIETPLTIDDAPLHLISKTVPLWVPCGSIAKYKGAANWNAFTTIRSACDLEVKVVANNTDYGSVTGASFYDRDSTATLTATAKPGYRLACWTVNGDTVSTDTIYSFTVTEDVTVTANFVQGGRCGDHLFWTITGNTLTISGTGDMYDYDYDYANDISGAPWHAYADSLTTLVIEPGATSIGAYAFITCRNFTGSLTIPDGVTTIGVYAFGYTGFNGTLTIPNSVTTIELQAFYACNFTGQLIIPNSVTTLGDLAFSFCRYFTGPLIIPNSVTTIGLQVFYSCRGFNGSLTIPESVTSIGEGAFSDCPGLNGPLTIPNSVTSIGEGAFSDCSGFTGPLTIPESVTNIDYDAFENCTGLDGALTIPASVTTIRNRAFLNCNQLTSINCMIENPLAISATTFSNVPKTIPLQVPCGSKAKYKGADFWNEFTNIISTCDHEVRAIANDTTYGSVTGAGVYEKDSIATLTATPAYGYNLVNWTAGGTVVSTANPYTFAVTKDSSLVANFAANQYTIAASANNPAYGTVTGADTYNYGTTATLTATPIAGHRFFNWTVGGTVVSTDSIYSFTVEGNVSLTANFIVTYVVTAIADNDTHGTVTGANTYDSGVTASVTATAKTGYRFVNWTAGGSVVSTDSIHNFTVTKDISLTANFVAKYTVTAIADNDTHGTVTGTATFDSGATATVTATAKTGYRFVNWTANGTAVSTNATYNFTVTGAITLTANFIATYTVTAIADNDTHGTVTGTATFDSGATATVTAVAKTGYRFVNWTANGTAVSTNATYNFTVKGNITLTANFIATYTVTAIADNDTHGTVTGTATFDSGATATVTATAKTGYRFVNWTAGGTAVSTNATYNFTVTGAITLTANFIATYTVTAIADNDTHGTVTGTATFDSGATATVTATAKTGYRFVNWTAGGTAVSTNATYNFTVTGAITLTANFIATYTVTAIADNDTHGTVTGTATFDSGATATVTATAKTGYRFVNWTAGGTAVSTNATYNFTVTGAITLTANFIATYTVTAIADNDTHGTVTGTATFDSGATATVTATAKTGYRFVNWTAGGTEVSTNATYNFTVTGAITLTANFIATYTVTAIADNDTHGTVTGTATFDSGATATVTATAENGYAFVNWTKDGVKVSTDAEYTFAVTENVTLTANFEEMLPTSIQETLGDAIKIYPNPTTGKVFIETGSVKVPQVRVFSMRGALLQQMQSTEVDLTNYAGGVYLLEVDGVMYKIIKK